jgi:glutathione S-transferase
MKLYGHPACGHTQRVLCALAEKNQDVELVVIDLATGGQKSSEHLARHPFGVIPVLEDDDGFQLYESRAIMRYLDDKLAGVVLTPDDARTRARMEQWISVEYSYFSPPCWPVFYQNLIVPLFGGKPDPDVVANSKLDMLPVLDSMQRALADQHYLAGEAFSLADLTFMPGIQLLFDTHESDIVEARPQLHTWWQRVSNRPSWCKQARKLDVLDVELDCVAAA